MYKMLITSASLILIAAIAGCGQNDDAMQPPDMESDTRTAPPMDTAPPTGDEQPRDSFTTEQSGSNSSVPDDEHYGDGSEKPQGSQPGMTSEQ